MRWRQFLPCFPILLLVLSLPHELGAQTTTSGGLAGVVTDPSGAVVPGASVEISDATKGTTQATKTDRDGVYQFFFLAPGRYTLAVTHAGFADVKRIVDVLLGPPVSVNITLQIAKPRSEITVTDEAPLVHAENGDVSATMNQKQISELPNPGNDLTHIAQIAPGVVMGAGKNDRSGWVRRHLHHGKRHEQSRPDCWWMLLVPCESDQADACQNSGTPLLGARSAPVLTGTINKPSLSVHNTVGMLRASVQSRHYFGPIGRIPRKR